MPNPITHDQLLDMCRLMDMNKDGLVDLNEFLETFRMVDPEQQSGQIRSFSGDLMSYRFSKGNNNNGLPEISTESMSPNVAQKTPDEVKSKKMSENGVQISSTLSEETIPEQHLEIFGSPVHASNGQSGIDTPLLSSPKTSNVTITITSTSPVSSPNSTSV